MYAVLIRSVSERFSTLPHSCLSLFTPIVSISLLSHPPLTPSLPPPPTNPFLFSSSPLPPTNLTLLSPHPPSYHSLSFLTSSPPLSPRPNHSTHFRDFHSDLKPENLLLTSVDDDASIKIADFGFAVECTDSSLTTRCGTPGKYGKART